MWGSPRVLLVLYVIPRPGVPRHMYLRNDDGEVKGSAYLRFGVDLAFIRSTVLN